MRSNLGLGPVDTGRMRAWPSTTRWTVRDYELGRVHVERLVGGVVVRLEVFTGGGFVPSHGVWRVAGEGVAVVEAGSD